MRISFSPEELELKLNILERSQLPYAGSRAMNQLRYQLKNSAWPKFAQRTFNRTSDFTADPSTLVSPPHKRGDLFIKIGLDRNAPNGQSPSRYLRPTTYQGPASVYVTRFSRYLKANSDSDGNPFMQGAYALAATANPALSNELDNGRVRRSFYQTVKSRLGQQQGRTKSGNKSGSRYADFRFFAVDKNSADPRVQHFKSRPGIYRVKDGVPTRIFAFLDPEPSVTPKWSFQDFAEDESRKILPSLLKRMLDEALR